MTVFAPQPGPRVFAIPPGVDAAQALAQGLRARFDGHPPEHLARTPLYLNTRRSAGALTQVLQEGPALLMPRVMALDELARVHGLAPERSDLSRALDLTALVARLLEADPRLGPHHAAFDLALSLGEVLDALTLAGVTRAQLRALPPEALQTHWQKSLAFVDLMLGDGAALAAARSPAMALADAVAAQIAAWRAAPPEGPVLAANSTASRAPTADLLTAIAHLPQGAVILPGLDPDLPAEALAQLLDPDAPRLDHPQAMLCRFLDRLGLAPGEVPLWHDTGAAPPPRSALMSLALRPAPVTDGWMRDGPALIPHLGAALDGVALVEAPTQEDEAQTLAWALRAGLQAGQRVALVSADRGLTRRVQAALTRWSIVSDDSAGRPAHLTPTGVFLRLVLSALDGPATPTDLAALLKHPLTASAPDQRGPHLRRVETFELAILRAGTPEVNFAVARETWAEGPEDLAWLDWIEGALAPAQPESLHARWQLHATRAARLAQGPDGDAGPEGAAGALWDKASGRACRALFDGLGEALVDSALRAPHHYPGILNAVLTGASVADRASNAHPNLAILGPREARMLSADLVVLAGLNEDSWPRQPQPDPWFSRGMRAALGLDLPERQLGLAAHDFQQAAGAPRIVLSRALRDASAPTVPSRWVLRLTNLLSGLGEDGKHALADMRARGAHLGAQARALAPPLLAPPAARPRPCPPVAARPKQLSVTRVEALIRDPYAIYAAYVLGLRPLDPLRRDADALSRGTAFHKVLERFIDATAQALPAPEPALTLWARLTEETLVEHVPWEAERVFWIHRLLRAGPAFLASEAARRAHGRPLKREVEGRTTLAGGAFTLTAKADRIDKMGEGAVALYDYKSSDPPSAEKLKEGTIQILLEACIAQDGGFEGVPAAHTGFAQIIGLTPDGKVTDATPDLGADRPRVEALIARLRDPAWPMTARLRPGQILDDTYDHLARLGEWEDGAP